MGVNSIHNTLHRKCKNKGADTAAQLVRTPRAMSPRSPQLLCGHNLIQRNSKARQIEIEV